MQKLFVVLLGVALIMGFAITQTKAQSPTEAQPPAEAEPPTETQPPAEAVPPTQTEQPVEVETPAKTRPSAKARMPAKATRIGLSGAGYDWLSLSDGGEESFSFFSIGSADVGTLFGGGAGLTLGHCVNENIETGLMFQFARFSFEGNVAMTNIKFIFYLDYNHPTSDKVVVFPEILLGFTTTDIEYGGTTSGFLLGGGYGLKYFIFENASFDLTLNYIYGILDAEDEDVTSSELLLKIGISLYFKKQ